MKIDLMKALVMDKKYIFKNYVKITKNSKYL